MTTKKALSALETRKLIQQYIIDCFDGDSLDGDFPTIESKLQAVASELRRNFMFPDNLRRLGFPAQGLKPAHLFRLWCELLNSCFMHFDFEYHKIGLLLESWGEVTEWDDTDKMMNRFWLMTFREFYRLCNQLSISLQP